MSERLKHLADKLHDQNTLENNEFYELIENRSEESAQYLFNLASRVREFVYGSDIYLRGLIEFTSYCKNDCLYCGIRKSNHSAQRYRLTSSRILECCEEGYLLGFRTFVLQGGEDPYFNDDNICTVVREIKSAYPDCAVTLSIGERSRESYKNMRDAGADRYLLRHETANPEHFRQLHPAKLKLENRMRCLRDLKELGFQVGCGFMVGSPHQSINNIISDLNFIFDFKPHMVGVGPFIPHHATPFADEPKGTLELTLYLLAIIRLMLPNVLLPATTALGTVETGGRELGLLAGANVVMPNLSPADVRSKYLLYDDKLCTGSEAAEGLSSLKKSIENAGLKIAVSRGDWRGG